jgi:hypothetical protein
MRGVLFTQDLEEFMLQMLNRAMTVDRVRKPAALVAAEDHLNDVRARRETLRNEAAIVRAQYMAKPSPALDRLIRDFDEEIATVEAKIVAARAARADLLTDYQAMAAAQLAKPISEAAAVLLRASTEARAAYRIIAEAAQTCGHEALRMQLGPVDAVALDRLVTLAEGLSKLDVVGSEA